MRIRYLTKWITPLLLLFLSAACSDEVSRVGSSTIRARDLARRVSVTEIYYPGSGKNYVALSQLIKGNLSIEMLRSLGRTVDDSVLEKEAQRIDQNTKAPEMLKRIKDVYRSDRKAYLRSFVALVYAERVLYSEVFLKSPDAQATERKQAESLLQQASPSPSSFMQTARKQGLSAEQFRVSLKYGVVPIEHTPLATPAPHEADLEHADRLHHLLETTKPGAIYPKVIEWQENFQVVRLLRRTGKDLIIESAAVAKRSYDEWFWEKASKVPVRITNIALKSELLKEVSWASRLKLD
ncbi:MAG: hypothetical protein OEW15_07470 [Nitrospirota bacterium]|nr:hypothetical protein [Nitrospirota bacterium]